MSTCTYSIPAREGWHLLTAPLFPPQGHEKVMLSIHLFHFLWGKNTQNKTKNAALVTPWANTRLRWMTRGHYRKQTLPILVIWNLPQENCLWEVSQCVGASSTSKITSRTLFRHHLSPGIYLKLFLQEKQVIKQRMGVGRAYKNHMWDACVWHSFWTRGVRDSGKPYLLW